MTQASLDWSIWPAEVIAARIPHRPFLSIHQFALEFDGLFFFGIEGKLVLYRPNRAN